MYECNECGRRELELDEADVGEDLKRLRLDGRLETIQVNLCPDPECCGTMWDLEKEQT